MQILFLILFFTVFHLSFIQGETVGKKEKQPAKIGNFALPSSQQPSGVVGFGENIIDKGEVQLMCPTNEFIGKNKTTINTIPSILFGVTETFSLLFNFPFTPLLKEDYHKSRGLEDFSIQPEYAFYTKSTANFLDQATLVANITFPTGSTKKDPATGFGAPSLFVGATYSHERVDWFVFTACGAVLTASAHKTKFGDQFLYQFGFGRNIPSPKGWIYAWMIEIDGQYSKKNRMHGSIDHNSGGNIITTTPSLLISSKTIRIHFGISFPINQNLFGRQRKFNYALNFAFAWSFY